MDFAQYLANHRSRITLERDGEEVTGLAKMATHQAKMVDRDARTIEFVVSNGTVDRDGDIVDPNGWDLDRYLQNPVVFWSHRSRDLPVAKAISIGVENDALVSTAQFVTAEANPLAEHVFQCYAQGALRAVSAGFIVRGAEDILDEGGRFLGMHITDQELWEYSAVGIPSNPDALMRAAHKGVELKWWREWATQEADEGRAPRAVKDALLMVEGKGIVISRPGLTLRAEKAAGEWTSDARDALEKAADALIAPEPGGVTDFPEKGDTAEVSLQNSSYPRFPVAEAEALRTAWPTIWAKGTAEAVGASPGEDAIRLRERSAADVIDTPGVAGVVECVRLRVVHARGLAYMRETLAAEKERIAEEARKGAPVITIINPGHERMRFSPEIAELAEAKG